MKTLRSNPTGLQSQIPWRFLVPLADPQTGKPDMRLRTFTTVGELLWYCCSPVCGSPTWQVWGLILLWLHRSYCLIEASSLSLDMGYPFFVDSSILLLMVVQQLVVILVLSQGDEQMSFYSTILNWSAFANNCGDVALVPYLVGQLGNWPFRGDNLFLSDSFALLPMIWFPEHFHKIYSPIIYQSVNTSHNWFL